MKFAVVVGVVVSVVAMTGCGGSEVLVHSQSARPIGETAAVQCPIEYKTLATATEAYWASTGGPQMASILWPSCPLNCRWPTVR